MPASVSPVSGNLGNKETATVTPYIVTAQSGTTITQIVERINGSITNTFNNPASLSRTLTAPQATWDALAYFATHTATVTVTDSSGAQTVATYTFVKRLSNTAGLFEAAKANSDARARISTKRDALATQVGLPAGSTFDSIGTAINSNFTKFATGTVSPGSSAQFAYVALTTITYGAYTATVSLSFQPKLVYLIQGKYFTVYLDDPSQSYPKTARCHESIDTLSAGDLTAVGLKADQQGAYVNATGFRLPVLSSSQQITYFAFG